MYRVLMADDEPIERMVVARTIEKYFGGLLEVVQAVNGREAVELFFEKDCHIALLDIEMPGMNGLEAAERIRERNKSCSIIFLTAFDEFRYAKRAISVKALDYLLKPGKDEELVAALEEGIRIAEQNEKPRGEKEADLSENQDQTEPEEIVGNLRMQAVAESIRNYIDAHYMEEISLQTMAGAMNYSDAYFCKIFKQCFDKSFILYLSEYRIEKAKQLLSDMASNVKDISIQVGYRDANYFAKVFKRMVGITPTEYRMKGLREQGKADEK